MLSDTGRARGLPKFWTLVFSMAVLVDPALAQTPESEIRGMPEVIDSDILKFGTQRVILWGVDAPDKKQTCQLDGKLFDCHGNAFRKLQLLAGRGEVVCRYQGEPDPFGRRFGICESGGEDLNAEMVKSGVALAFEEETDAYLGQMAEAIGAGAGLWQIGVEFEEPWLFRRRETPGGYR